MASVYVDKENEVAPAHHRVRKTTRRALTKLADDTNVSSVAAPTTGLKQTSSFKWDPRLELKLPAEQAATAKRLVARLKHRPHQVMAWWQLIHLYHKYLGSDEAVIADILFVCEIALKVTGGVLEEAGQTGADSRDAFAKILLAKAKFLFQTGDHDGALHLYKSMLTSGLGKNFYFFYVNYANIVHRTGKTAKAVQILKDGLLTVKDGKEQAKIQSEIALYEKKLKDKSSSASSASSGSNVSANTVAQTPEPSRTSRLLAPSVDAGLSTPSVSLATPRINSSLRKPSMKLSATPSPRLARGSVRRTNTRSSVAKSAAKTKGDEEMQMQKEELLKAKLELQQLREEKIRADELRAEAEAKAADEEKRRLEQEAQAKEAAEERQREAEEEAAREAKEEAEAKKAGVITPTASTAISKAQSCPEKGKKSSKMGKLEEVLVNNKPYYKVGIMGKGGSATVFRVARPKQVQMKQTVHQSMEILALKVVELSQEGAESLRGEIRHLLSLRNERNVVTIIDYEITATQVFVVMELGEQDLRRLLHSLRHYSNRINYIRCYWQQMLECVATIGRHRIVHGDLKPANFVCFKGIIKLIDFGIAGKIQDHTVNLNRDHISGTVNYLAPEGMRRCNLNGSQVSKMGTAADVWSLGVILFEMVYDTTPFAKIPGFVQKVVAITDDKEVTLPPMPVENEQLKEVLASCLRKDPARRPTVQQLLDHPFLH